jgi:hypothetical protein
VVDDSADPRIELMGDGDMKITSGDVEITSKNITTSVSTPESK